MAKWIHELERNPDIKFGFYMRPSPSVSAAQVMVHQLLRKQFGLVAGGSFMPHATIKGFFRSDASLADLREACTRALDGFAAVPIVNNGVMASGNRGIALNVHQNEQGETNQHLQQLHESVWKQIEPHIHPDCENSSHEPALDRFFAHLTLAMADVPEFAFEEIFQFVSNLEPLGERRFLASNFHLYAFHSESWNDEWWHTLDWKLLDSWTLPNPVEDPWSWKPLANKWRSRVLQ